LIIYSEESEYVTLTNLCLHLKYNNQSYLKNKILKGLDKEEFIELTDDDKIYLLPPGEKYVEENYDSWKP
jgi:Mn-dependent DtxR family transcriptional regulator